MGILDTQTKYRIGKSAAILFSINEGLWKQGFLDEETYELYKKKYSKPLLEIVKGNRQGKIEAAKRKVRCGWVGCRRIGVAMVRWHSIEMHSVGMQERIFAVCPEHLKEAKNSSEYQILSDQELE